MNGLYQTMIPIGWIDLFGDGFMTTAPALTFPFHIEALCCLFVSKMLCSFSLYGDSYSAWSSLSRSPS
jgi:hypothetical protein